MKKYLYIIGLSLSMLGSAQADPLKVFLEPNYPPYAFNDEHGLFTGFEIELLNEIAKVKNFEPEYYKAPRRDLEKVLNDDTGHVFISAFSRNPDRLRLVDMTDSTIDFEWVATVLNSNNNIQHLSDLTDKKISVSAGSDSALKRAAALSGDESYVIPEKSIFLVFKNVYTQKAEAVIMDDVVSAYYQTLHPEIKLRNISLGEGRIDLGFAVKKGNTELLQQLNEGLAEVKSNGTYAKLLEKYFGTAFSESRQ